MGLLVTDLTREYTTTMITLAANARPEALTAAFESLERQGMDDLAREQVSQAEISFVRQLDMRYKGQSHELNVSVPQGTLTETELAAVLAAFHAEHDRVYGHSAPSEPVELVNVRVTAIGRISKPRLREIESSSESAAPRAHRQVYFAEGDGFVSCPIFDRYQLAPATAVEGPAIVEEFDTTTVVHPGYTATVDQFGNLILGKHGREVKVSEREPAAAVVGAREGGAGE
jgi:N-methylhydantoinase A